MHCGPCAGAPDAAFIVNSNLLVIVWDRACLGVRAPALGLAVASCSSVWIQLVMEAIGPAGRVLRRWNWRSQPTTAASWTLPSTDTWPACGFLPCTRYTAKAPHQRHAKPYPTLAELRTVGNLPAKTVTASSNFQSDFTDAGTVSLTMRPRTCIVWSFRCHPRRHARSRSHTIVAICGHATDRPVRLEC